MSDQGDGILIADGVFTALLVLGCLLAFGLVLLAWDMGKVKGRDRIIKEQYGGHHVTVWSDDGDGMGYSVENGWRCSCGAWGLHPESLGTHREAVRLTMEFNDYMMNREQE